MPQTAQRYTLEEVLAFPNDGNRYELVHGELLVTPAPRSRHQFVVGELFARLRDYLLEHRDRAIVFLSPADISWEADVLVQPDIFVVPREEVGPEWHTIHTLLLAVEVISPGSARHDRVVKRKLYQEHGVATYWVVDPDAAVVEVWHPEDDRPEIVTDILRWRFEPEAPDMAIPLIEVLALS